MRQIGRAARMDYMGSDGELRMTTPPRSLKEQFLAALEVAPADRAAWLERECAADIALREHLRLMLAAHDAPQSLLDRPAQPLVASLPRKGVGPTVGEPITERPGAVIGPYKLMEQIGEGGMGLVFVAEQQHPVRRQVALKVIKPGMDTRAVVARFEAERQALALMDHPNIAKVLDGGETTSGRPYFVMELVKGSPITEYGDQNQVPIRERLGLFLNVCEAVQHAHQKGIIHRDIKPSNVLVVSHDGKPVVKVIDFGVAKATGQHLTDKTVYTQVAQLIGTPLYMSPEQAGLSGLDVDTRSDIYSLGVLLYELLTGTNSSSRSRGVSWLASQNRVMGTPWTSSMTKYGRPLSVVPASRTLAMFWWSMSARACRSASNRAITWRESIPGRMILSATLRRTGVS